MSTHNIGFYEEISKLSFNYHQISSNMQLISSAGKLLVYNCFIQYFIAVLINCFIIEL